MVAIAWFFYFDPFIKAKVSAGLEDFLVKSFGDLLCITMKPQPPVAKKS